MAEEEFSVVVADNGSGTCNTARMDHGVEHVCKFLLRMLGYAHSGQPTVIFRVFVNAWICAQRATDRDLQSFL